MESSSDSKTIILIRHGSTVSNEYEKKYNWSTPNFVDPNLWDTHLSPIGISQAEALRHSVRDGDNPFEDVDIIMSSPLRRALQTTEIIFSDHLEFPAVPRLAVPLARERVYFSADVGRHKHELVDSHPSFDFDLIEDHSDWWYTPDNEEFEEWRPYPHIAKYACAGEPGHVFADRMRQLKQWLSNRSENKIVLVAHWGVIRALTGKVVDNCTVVVTTVDQMLVDLVVDDS